VIVGVIVSGDTSVRAAHSLASHPGVDEVVVFAPATSKTFRVVPDGAGIDVAVGSGDDAPGIARRLGVPLVWDGETLEDGVVVYGAAPQGLALALAAREADPQLVALAHPSMDGGSHQKIRFPDPIGRRSAVDDIYAGKRVATAKSPNVFAAALTNGAARRVTIVDQSDFLDGIALAAGVGAIGEVPGPVWESALGYLKAVTEMGLIMAEGGG
jgi:hypothetical protein